MLWAVCSAHASTSPPDLSLEPRFAFLPACRACYLWLISSLPASPSASHLLSLWDSHSYDWIHQWVSCPHWTYYFRLFSELPSIQHVWSMFCVSNRGPGVQILACVYMYIYIYCFLAPDPMDCPFLCIQVASCRWLVYRPALRCCWHVSPPLENELLWRGWCWVPGIFVS